MKTVGSEGESGKDAVKKRLTPVKVAWRSEKRIWEIAYVIPAPGSEPRPRARMTKRKVHHKSVQPRKTKG
jgi:hypothetical protein